MAIDFVDRIYPIELEIKDTTYTDRSASYLDLHFEIDNDGRWRTKPYDQWEDFNIPIVNLIEVLVARSFLLCVMFCRWCVCFVLLCVMFCRSVCVLCTFMCNVLSVDVCALYFFFWSLFWLSFGFWLLLRYFQTLLTAPFEPLIL